MVEIRDIREEDKSSYQKLLDDVRDNLEGEIYSPKLITTDDNLYVIDGYGNFFTMVSDLEDLLLIMRDNELFSLVDGMTQYQINLKSDTPVLTKKHLEKDTTEQIFIEYPRFEGASTYLHYYQGMEGDKVQLEFKYDLEKFLNNLDAYFMYLSSKKPDVIYFNYYKKLLGLIKYKIKNRFVLEPDSNEYYKVLFEFNNDYCIIPALGSTPEEKIKGTIEELGFNSNCDKELIDMFRGNSKRVKILNQCVDAYRRRGV